MNKQQKKALRELRPELQQLVIEQASKGIINFDKPKDQQEPVNIGMFQALAEESQTKLF